jgi:hypothetical protein
MPSRQDKAGSRRYAAARLVQRAGLGDARESGKSRGQKVANARGAWLLRRMKWLLLILVLCVAALFVPIAGGTLWSRGVAKWAAKELRAGINWVAGVGHESGGREQHEPPATPKPGVHSPKPPAQRATRDGIVPQPPKERIQADDQAKLKELIAHSR